MYKVRLTLYVQHNKKAVRSQLLNFHKYNSKENNKFTSLNCNANHNHMTDYIWVPSPYLTINDGVGLVPRLSRYSILQAMDSWVGPGNKAMME